MKYQAIKQIFPWNRIFLGYHCSMKKYSDIKEIDTHFNRRIAQLEYQRKKAKEQFADWLNVKKFTKSDSKEQVRQACMKLLQVNCRMLEAVNTNSINIKCCSCDSMMPWRDLQWGHYITRSDKRTWCMQININPQCSSCNYKCMLKDQSTLDRYAEYIIDRYWQSEYNQLIKLSQIKWPLQVTKQHWEILRDKLKKENEEIWQQIVSLWLHKK